MHTHVPTTDPCNHSDIHTQAHTHMQTSPRTNYTKNSTSKNQMGRGRNFNTPTKTARKTRQHKWKTRLNFKVSHCIYMLNNEITYKYIVHNQVKLTLLLREMKQTDYNILQSKYLVHTYHTTSRRLTMVKTHPRPAEANHKWYY